ncbi:DNA replication helicase Dna2 [Mitosporidium daphniae]|uniref:DNA helicase n=1 Tax=Mitosporidium daphniae TaxID=1485682 RepID=A0A098VSR8_9MICR|nr:DNA replication helicase Dna2 [Mitosporidium daphniae]KGG52020.1 DNA replication helicase Dna2 [Mitosporidium daphniae]|eukprot:XP_013238456.1 DNA replication helicase Dna2 [Mitosporidium daphniae]
MEDDDNIEASNEFCSSSQPYISWVPSPPSKKIKKYIYQLPPLVRNHALHVSESVTPMEILKHQDPKDLFSDDYDVNVNLGENQTHNDNQHENENEDYFDNLILSSESLFFNSELQEFVEDGSKYITEDDNELFFACATQIETISSLEEAIGKFTAIQISIKEIFAHDSGLIVSVLSIKEYSFKSLCLQKKKWVVDQFISVGESFNLALVSSTYPIKFESVIKELLVFNRNSHEEMITIKTGLISRDIHMVPIFAPHILITGSSIADSFFCERRTAISLSYPLCDPEGELPESTEKMQIGNLLHFLLEKCLINADFQAATILSFIEDFPKKHAINASLMFPLNDGSTQNQLVSILQQWASAYFPSARGIPTSFGDSNSVQIAKVIAVEFPIFSISLGIQGKLDALVLTTNGKIAALEIKSGAPSQQNSSHQAQLLLYHSLICYLSFLMRSDKDIIQSSLLSYISFDFRQKIPENSHSLEEVGSCSRHLVSLLFRRNEIAFGILGGGHYSKLPFPFLQHSSSWKCNICPVKRTCNRLSNLQNNGAPLATKDFFNSWHQVLTTEQQQLYQSTYDIISTFPDHSDWLGIKALSFLSFAPSTLLLVLTLCSGKICKETPPIRLGDPSILMLDLAYYFPNLTFPVFGCFVLFKLSSSGGKVKIGIKLPFDPFSVFIEFLKTTSKQVERFDFSELKYYICRNEKGSVGWRSQPSFLLDAIDCDAAYKPIFENPIIKPKSSCAEPFDLSLFKCPSLNSTSNKNQYSVLEKYLHPNQSLAVSCWLDSIKKNFDHTQKPFQEISQRIHLVLGMPGCGKTRSLVLFIYQFLMTFPAHSNLLITTFTHAAIDAIIEKINDLFPNISALIHRHSNSKADHGSLSSLKPEALENAGLFDIPCNQLPSEPSPACRIVFSTVLGLASFAHSKVKFSAVVVDESSQILLPLSIFPLRYAPLAILIGDHCQLRPLLSLNSGQNSNNTFPSFFEAVLELPQHVLHGSDDVKLSVLKSQFRMNSHLSSICNSLFYSDLMETQVSHTFLDVLNWSTNGTSACMGVPWKQSFSAFHPNTLERSLVGIDIGKSKNTSAELIILKSLLMVYSFGLDPENDQHQVAVLSPYHAVLDNLRDSFYAFCDEFKSQNYPSLKINALFSTIDSMQGKESALVILFLGRDSTKSLMSDPRRLNVALSRASKKLVIVGSFEETLRL